MSTHDNIIKYLQSKPRVEVEKYARANGITAKGLTSDQLNNRVSQALQQKYSLAKANGCGCNSPRDQEYVVEDIYMSNGKVSPRATLAPTQANAKVTSPRPLTAKQQAASPRSRIAPTQANAKVTSPRPLTAKQQAASPRSRAPPTRANAKVTSPVVATRANAKVTSPVVATRANAKVTSPVIPANRWATQYASGQISPTQANAKAGTYVPSNRTTSLSPRATTVASLSPRSANGSMSSQTWLERVRMCTQRTGMSAAQCARSMGSGDMW